MMKKRLLAVQGPQQFIAGLIAMHWYGQQQEPEQKYFSVLLMYDFLMPEHLESDFVRVIRDLSSVAEWDKVVFISGAEMRGMMRGRYAGATAKLRQHLGEAEFDEIHIGRDFCGDGSPLILNAYPQSARVLYGDSFGLVGNEEVCDTFNWRSPVRATASACKAFLLEKVNGTHRRFDFDTAVLTLPLDWSGRYLDNLPLMVPSRDFVRAKVKHFSAMLPALNAYEESLLNLSSKNYLILLSNLSASGYMTEESEIDLYCQTVAQLAPPNARILLKAHPRAHERILNGVVKRLSLRYNDVKIIDDVALSRIPVELWLKLLENCTIVPVFSTSAINLKYFYDRSVVLPLTPTVMEKYCYPDKLDAFKKAYRVIAEAVQNLNSWDNKSVLWKAQ